MKNFQIIALGFIEIFEENWLNYVENRIKYHMFLIVFMAFHQLLRYFSRFLRIKTLKKFFEFYSHFYHIFGCFRDIFDLFNTIFRNFFKFLPLLLYFWLFL